MMTTLHAKTTWSPLVYSSNVQHLTSTLPGSHPSRAQTKTITMMPTTLHAKTTYIPQFRQAFATNPNLNYSHTSIVQGLTLGRYRFSTRQLSMLSSPCEGIPNDHSRQFDIATVSQSRHHPQNAPALPIASEQRILP